MVVKCRQVQSQDRLGQKAGNELPLGPLLKYPVVGVSTSHVQITQDLCTSAQPRDDSHEAEATIRFDQITVMSFYFVHCLSPLTILDFAISRFICLE